MTYRNRELDKCPRNPENPRPSDRESAAHDSRGRRRGSTRKLSGKRTVRNRKKLPDSGERRTFRPPKGRARVFPRNLSGIKDRGVERARACRPFSFFLDLETPCRRPHPLTKRIAPRARARSISAAGTCRSTTAR